MIESNLFESVYLNKRENISLITLKINFLAVVLYFVRLIKGSFENLFWKIGKV